MIKYLERDFGFIYPFEWIDGMGLWIEDSIIISGDAIGIGGDGLLSR